MAKDTPETIASPGLDAKPGWRLQWRRLRVLRWRDLAGLATETVANWYAHNVPRLGASLAFYTLLSLAPLLIIVVAIAGAVFGRQAAEGQLVLQIRDLMGDEGAQTVQTLLRGAYQSSGGVAASILGVITVFYGATAAVAELRDALNTIWCVPRKQNTAVGSVVSVLRDRGFAVVVVVAVGVVLLLSLAANTVLAAAGKWYRSTPFTFEFAFHSADFVVSYLFLAVVFALMYKLMPDLRLEWRDVIPGALGTALLFSIGKVLIAIYLGKATIASAYGAAGSLVVLLIWVYYSAQIFFLGAEFTQVYAQKFGSRPCDRVGREVTLASSMSSAGAPRETPEIVQPGPDTTR